MFTHNDSGDSPRFFAVDGHGRTRTTFDVARAEANDWEDMARGRGRDGKPALYIGDIGDNARSVGTRSHVVVYEVAEPRVDARARRTVRAGAAYRLRYADGPRNAETLLVDPASGRIAVVTKNEDGRSGVYLAPADPSPTEVSVMERVATIALGEVGSAAGFGLQLLATGGAVSADGKYVVVRSYFEALEWPLEDFDLAGAFAKEPVRVPLAPAGQGEAIAYSGTSLITTSEGLRAPVYRSRLREAR